MTSEKKEVLINKAKKGWKIAGQVGSALFATASFVATFCGAIVAVVEVKNLMNYSMRKKA